MVTFELKCQKCGGELKENGRLFECEYCHAKYESDSVEKEKAALASLLDEQKQEQLLSVGMTAFCSSILTQWLYGKISQEGSPYSSPSSGQKPTEKRMPAPPG